MSRTLRLLIVDENAVDGNGLEGFLSQSAAGFCETQHADGLDEALHRMQESPPDVVLVDLDLPGGQGLRCLTSIHAQSPGVPVIVVTGQDDEKKAASAIQSGAQDYLVKGRIDANLLVRSIRYARERKRAERELQAADQRYRTIFDNSAAAIMMADCRERLVSWNRFTERLLGMEPADLLGRDVSSLYPKSEWKRIRGMNLCERETLHQLETKMIRKDGRIIDVDVSLSLLKDSNGVVTGSIGVVSDVTERKHMEKALRKSQARLRRIIEQSTNIFYSHDVKHVFTYISPQAKDVLGYGPDEIPRRWLDLITDNPVNKEARRLTEQAIATGQAQRPYEVEVLTKQGQTKWLEIHETPMVRDGRTVSIVGAASDITARKRAEDVLREANRRLTEIIEFLPDPTFAIDCHGTVTAWNKACEEMTGVPKAEMIGKGDHEYTVPLYGYRRPILIDLLLNPDDGCTAGKYCGLNRVGDTLCGESYSPEVFEGRGAFLWGNASLLRDASGSITGAIETIRDITERKRVETTLRQSEERMRLIVDASPLPLHLTRPATGEIVVANRATCELFGYDRDEMLRRVVPELYADAERDRPGVLAELRDHGRVAQRELVMRKSDGTIFPVLLSLEPVEYMGEPAILAVVYDVTERKRADEMLRRHVQQVERFNRLTTAREMRIIELKKQVNDLLCAAGKPPAHRLTDDEPRVVAEVDDEPAQEEHASVLRIEELLDRDRIQRLLESYSDAVGVPSAIVDTQGRVFVGARWQSICTDFHRVHPETCARCVESDTILAGQLEEGERFTCYQCRNGLTDAAAPIIIEGQHVANVFIGQFLLNPPDTEFFRAQAREFGFDETAYLEALAHVPVVSEEKLYSMLQYLTTCAQLLAETGLERIRASVSEADLLHHAEELNRTSRAMCEQREAALSLAEDANEARAAAEWAQQSLQKSEEQLRTVISAVRDGIVMMDPDGEVSLWSPGAEALFGWTADEAIGKPVHQLLAPERFSEKHVRGFAQFRASGRGPAVGTTLELEARHKDGHEFPVELSLSAIEQGGRWCAVGVVRDITERKRAEEALLVKDSAVNTATNGIVFVDLQGRLTFANASCLAMLGYENEGEVLNRPFMSFLESGANGWKMYRSTIESGTSSGELTARRKDGSTFILQVAASLVKDKRDKPLCVMASLADITESRRVQEILDWKQKNLSAIFDAAPLGMLLVNEQGLVVRANDAVRQMTGKGYRQLLNRTPCRTLSCIRAADGTGTHCASTPCETCLLQRLVETTFECGTPVHGAETRPVLSRNGTELRPWLAVSMEPVNIDGGRHVLIAMNDITDRKEAEEQLRQTMEMKSQFISTVSHELRTPLTAMREAVTIVADGVAGKLSKDQKHFLDIAKRNIDRLARLIDDVLDFQKLSAGKMKLHMQPNHIDRTVEEAYSTMLPHAQQKQLHLSVDLEPDLPVMTYDHDRMIQVLTNLLSNAIKFTPEGGRVSVCARRREDCLALSVGDTGLGIPKEALPKIFTRFHRVHRPGKEIKGTGLGLAIVDRIVAAHGGRIEVESEVDRGTTFTVLLPWEARQSDNSLLIPADECLENVLTDNTKA